MAKNEAKIRFSAETSQFNDAIKKSNDEMSKLRAEMKLNDTKMQATGETVEGLENKHKILSAQLEASKDKTEALRQKVEKASEIFGENSTEVTKLETQLFNAETAEEKLRQAISKCEADLQGQKNETNQTEAATEELGDAVQDAAADVESASEGFTVMKGAMADLVADGIEAVISGFAEIAEGAFVMANDIDSATNTFLAKTGESAESAGEFEDVMTSIYNNNYGESFEDISESMATVKTAMGDLGTDDLERITTDALVLRDTFDMDVNESIRAVNSMMDQFGITADEAYNLIAQGAQNGLNQNGDLLDVVNEYSVQFSDAGYSAEDMFNMLANGADSGTWSVDKLGDAVKEMNIRFSDGTADEAIEALGLELDETKEKMAAGGTTAQEATNQIITSLLSVEDEQERYNLGVQIFGTMWEDLGEDAVGALMNTQGEISVTSDALAEINAVKYDDLGSAIEGIKRNLSTSVTEPIKNEVMPAVNEFIQDIDWAATGQAIGEAFGAVVEGALALVDATMQAVQWMQEHKGVVIAVASVVGVLTTAIAAYNAVQAIKTAMDAAQVTTIWGLVAAHWAQAAAAAAALAPYLLVVAAIAAVIAIIVLCIMYWDEIVAAVKAAWETIKATLATWGEWINTNVIQPIVDFFTGLWDSIVAIFQSVIDWVVANWQSILLFIINPFAGAFNYLYENFEGFRTFVDGILASIKEFFVNFWNGIVEIWTNLTTATSEAWTAIKDTISSIWTGIKTSVSSAINSVSATVTGIWTSIKTTTASIWTSIKTAITSVWTGIKTGVSSAINSVRTTVSSVFTSVKTTVTSIWNSIKTAITTPIEAAKTAVSNAIEAIKGFFNFSWSLPPLKLPHISISGQFSLTPLQVPRFSISWYKDGAIFEKPTLFNTPYGLKGVGEAGAEAVLPIDKLEGYVANAIEKSMTVVNMESLANAIADLASRPISMNINGRQFAYATASDGDSVNGLRSSFRTRGLAIE